MNEKARFNRAFLYLLAVAQHASATCFVACISIIWFGTFSTQRLIGDEMSIAIAIQKGSNVYVYDAQGATLCVLPSGSQSSDGIRGYTSGTVSIQRGNFVYTYDAKGRTLNIVGAGR